ncbi:MAG: hypothetical protein LBU11_08945 [Zoogloeaceae bacterium]|jgi:spermidine/putrescine-binding protein|nr:hypothetical protein [Zoogloeaceae bacterium]
MTEKTTKATDAIVEGGDMNASRRSVLKSAAAIAGLAAVSLSASAAQASGNVLPVTADAGLL